MSRESHPYLGPRSPAGADLPDAVPPVPDPSLGIFRGRLCRLKGARAVEKC